MVVAGPPKILSPRKGFGTPEDSSYDLAELLKARAGSKLIRTARLDQIFGRKLAKRREVSCFLFDDLLLVAELFELLSKEKDVSHGKSRYTTLAAVPLKHMSVTDLSGLEGVEHGVQVEDITEGECLILDMGTVGVKLEWLKALRVRLVSRCTTAQPARTISRSSSANAWRRWSLTCRCVSAPVRPTRTRPQMRWTRVPILKSAMVMYMPHLPTVSARTRKTTDAVAYRAS